MAGNGIAVFQEEQLRQARELISGAIDNLSYVAGWADLDAEESQSLSSARDRLNRAHRLLSDMVMATMPEAPVSVVRKNSLPDLQGSEKQVRWATQIRREKMEAFNDQYRDEGDEVFADVFIANRFAGWWIDRRFSSVSLIVADLKRRNGSEPRQNVA